MSKVNNQNDFSKRTSGQIASILIANGIPFKPENLGDGRTFYINDNTLKSRVNLKKAGFKLVKGASTDKGLTFKTF